MSSCAICGDQVSRQSDGVRCCRSCRETFDSIARGRSRPVCLKSGVCPVFPRRRLQCLACFFNRCVAEGMTAEGSEDDTGHFASNHMPVDDSPAEMPDSSCGPDIPNSDYSTVDLLRTRSSFERRDQALSLDARLLSCLGGIDLNVGNLILSEEDYILDRVYVGDSYVLQNPDVSESDPFSVVCKSLEEQFPRMLRWALRAFILTTRPLSSDDQFHLFRSAWADMFVLSAAYRSIKVQDGLLLSNGTFLSRANTERYQLLPLMDRFLTELVLRFREIQLTFVEMIILRAIILFNPDTNDLSNRNVVEATREELNTCIHSVCMSLKPRDPSRFSKLILRLPTIHSIAQKWLEHLVLLQCASEDSDMQGLLSVVGLASPEANSLTGI